MNPVWIILFAPLCAAVVITLLTRKMRMLSALISIGAIVVGFILSLKLLLVFAHTEAVRTAIRQEAAQSGAVICGLDVIYGAVPFQWLVIGDVVRIEFGANIDRLSLLMLLVVTGVGSAIHIYSLGYMKGDPGFSRYFACLSLFTFSMLGIVLANNFIQIFIFWELVGVSSYLLIGYWYERPSAAEAGKKAFLVNRIGDFGMMLGVLLLWTKTGTFNFAELPAKIAQIPPRT